jgi:hypothetical protein
MSQGKFRYWPTSVDGANNASRLLLTHEFHALICGGNPSLAQAAPMWCRRSMPRINPYGPTQDEMPERLQCLARRPDRTA